MGGRGGRVNEKGKEIMQKRIQQIVDKNENETYLEYFKGEEKKNYFSEESRVVD